MTVREFVKDRMACYLVFTGVFLFCIGMGILFQANTEYLIMTGFVMLLGGAITEYWEYHRKNRFYRDLLRKLELLDQKFLITEMLEQPGFLEGKIFENALYEIDKSMKEQITQMENSVREFQEYIEMWIHEIKIPISSLMLMNYNRNIDFDKEKKQLAKLNHYVEQILFYSRTDASSKDYLLKKTCLQDVVNKVLLEQKDILIENRFRIEKEGLDCFVHTDSKWLEFMLGQVVNNSVKYKKEQPYLKFTASKEENKILLTVEDHGIGIPVSDINRVFEKTFTGENGRKVQHSTGMGLFLCKKMCDKLGHELSIESKEKEYTKVCFRFGMNQYVEEVLK